MKMWFGAYSKQFEKRGVRAQYYSESNCPAALPAWTEQYCFMNPKDSLINYQYFGPHPHPWVSRVIRTIILDSQSVICVHDIFFHIQHQGQAEWGDLCNNISIDRSGCFWPVPALVSRHFNPPSISECLPKAKCLKKKKKKKKKRPGISGKIWQDSHSGLI